MDYLQDLMQGNQGIDEKMNDSSEQIFISSLALVKMLKVAIKLIIKLTKFTY